MCPWRWALSAESPCAGVTPKAGREDKGGGTAWWRVELSCNQGKGNLVSQFSGQGAGSRKFSSWVLPVEVDIS